MLVNRYKFMTNSTLTVTKVANSLVILDIVRLAFYAVERAGFPTERTAVCVWVIAINFAYYDTLEASYGRFLSQPAISGTQTHATALLFGVYLATTSHTSLRIRWEIPNEKPNLSAISEKVLRQSSWNTANFQPLL
jgi:hypothetical protein